MRRRTLLGAVACLASRPAGAQSPPCIGWLSRGERVSVIASFADGFRHGLGQAGFIEGQNVLIERRYADGNNERLPALAAELVARKVDVIVTVGGSPPARAAKAATSTIPVVFATGEDPVADGLVASLARPGGNLTGISILAVDLNAKRIDLLRQLVPNANPMALLVNPANATVEHEMRSFREERRPGEADVVVEQAGDEAEIDAAFTAIVRQRAGALVVSSDPVFLARRRQIAGLAARHGLPAIYAWRECAADGGLLAYGPGLGGVASQLGVYAGRILKGARPADLPVEQPTVFDLVINLRAARALGLSVPPTLLGLATEVIE